MNQNEAMEVLNAIGFQTESYRGKHGKYWRVKRNGMIIYNQFLPCQFIAFAIGVQYMALHTSGEFK